MNDWQKHRFSRRIVRALFNTIADKRIAVLGLACKKDTNDTRESAAITICRDLLAEEARVVVYDPKVSEAEIREAVLGRDGAAAGAGALSRLSVTRNPYDAAVDSHAIAILTEWDEFKELEYSKIYNQMTRPASIFDGRNILDRPRLERLGFRVYGIGK